MSASGLYLDPESADCLIEDIWAHHDHSRGTVHFRDHRRENEFVRDVVLANGIIDLEAPDENTRGSQHGVRVYSGTEGNRFDRLTLRPGARGGTVQSQCGGVGRRRYVTRRFRSWALYRAAPQRHHDR